MERGWERAVRSAKVTEKGDRKIGRIQGIYIFFIWAVMIKDDSVIRPERSFFFLLEK